MATPRLYSKFNETSGILALDSSGHGLTGTLHSDMGEGPINFADGSLYSDGAYGNYVQYPEGACEITGDLTITLRFKPILVPYFISKTMQWLVIKQPSTGYQRTYSLGLGTTVGGVMLVPMFWVGRPDATGYLCEILSDTPVSLDEWHFIAVKRNAATGAAKMQVDNTWFDADIAEAGPANLWPVPSEIPLHVAGGNWQTVGHTTFRSFGGYLKELQIYDSVLTDDEIEEIFYGTPLPIVIPEVEYDRALDTLPSSVRVGTWANQRTTRGRR